MSLLDHSILIFPAGFNVSCLHLAARIRTFNILSL